VKSDRPASSWTITSPSTTADRQRSPLGRGYDAGIPGGPIIPVASEGLRVPAVDEEEEGAAPATLPENIAACACTVPGDGIGELERRAVVAVARLAVHPHPRGLCRELAERRNRAWP
jgi:hypothetical protein